MRTNEFKMSVSIPNGPDGRIGRKCPSGACSPAYFKVKSDTGITDGHKVAYCPYCRFEAEPGGFATREQIRYAKDHAINKVHKDIDRIFKDAFGGKKKVGGDFLSIETSYKPEPKRHVRKPFDEVLKRDVLCPHCGLDHSVYGLATWCADCGADIFLTHIEAELVVVRTMLSDVDRRSDVLGIRIAAKDLENCLEDTVSIFEAVLRAFSRRHLVARDTAVDDIDRFFKDVGNAFQNIRRAEEIFLKELEVSLLQGLSTEEIEGLKSTFEKRHPITHNLGVVDRKYIERARTAKNEGKEILVTSKEIEKAIACSLKIFRLTHERLFSEEG